MWGISACLSLNMSMEYILQSLVSLRSPPIQVALHVNLVLRPPSGLLAWRCKDDAFHQHVLNLQVLVLRLFFFCACALC